MKWTKQPCSFPQSLILSLSYFAQTHRSGVLYLVSFKLVILLVTVDHPIFLPHSPKRGFSLMTALSKLCDSAQSPLWSISWPLWFPFPGRNSRNPPICPRESRCYQQVLARNKDGAMWLCFPERLEESPRKTGTFRSNRTEFLQKAFVLKFHDVENFLVRHTYWVILFWVDSYKPRLSDMTLSTTT